MECSRDRILMPQAIKRMIAEGQAIVIFDDFVLRLDSWLSKHPGGRLAILHMIGKDATDEMTVVGIEKMRGVSERSLRCPEILTYIFAGKCSYHSAATLKTMKAFRIGRKPPGPWTNLTPPIRGGVYHQEEEVVVEADTASGSNGEDKFPASKRSVNDENTTQSPNVRRRADAHERPPHQIMFTAHDAGHLAITHIFAVDTLIGLFIADFCCGLSLGWWKSSHNVHHLVTNHPEHDPDIQNVPLFATCPSFFRSICSTYYDNFVFVWDAAADFLVPYQRYTYYPIMGVARFNLYLLSWLHVLSAKSTSLGRSKAWWIRPTEITFICCYLFLYGYCLVWRTLPTWTIRIAFVLVSHIITMPLHVQITLSHWGMSTSELGETESFPQRQLRTTMDVDCPAWLDFIHGGLQFQAVHHLFPRVPRHNLRKAQTLVKEFCQEVDIPYTILGFADGNRKVLGRLEEVSEQLKHLVQCQQYMAETRESGLH
ncbi:hypothetical protein ONZ43_g1423 [Nemania bipapillata]|uniref:Uncharacterized protein n=1 Tax=Nemania bipapillata TaxID=110536 RepID=A0ACC2J4H4_9PEZI|nr:hypothetical protein ONZ43_g1423 [Nemania bipapillata]